MSTISQIIIITSSLQYIRQLCVLKNCIFGKIRYILPSYYTYDILLVQKIK